MAESLATQIKKKERQLKALKDRVPLSIGKAVLNAHKMPVLNASGKPVTYTSKAKSTKGKTMIRYRKLHSLDEFNKRFAVVPKDNALSNDTMTAIDNFCKKFGAANEQDFTGDINQILNFDERQSNVFNGLLHGKYTNDDASDNDSDSNNNSDAD